MNVKLARLSASLSQVAKWDRDSRPSRVFVTGRAEVRDVTLEYSDDFDEPLILSDCGCKGNRNGICYHSLAAVICAIEHDGYKLSLSEYRGNLVRLSKIYRNSVIIEIGSQNNDKVVFGLMYKEADKKTHAEDVDLPGELLSFDMVEAIAY